MRARMSLPLRLLLVLSAVGVAVAKWKLCSCADCPGVGPAVTYTGPYFIPPCPRERNPYYGKCHNIPGAATFFISNQNIAISTIQDHQGGRAPVAASCPSCETGQQKTYSCINPDRDVSDVHSVKNLTVGRIFCEQASMLCIYGVDGKRYQGYVHAGVSANVALLPVPYCYGGQAVMLAVLSPSDTDNPDFIQKAGVQEYGGNQPYSIATWRNGRQLLTFAQALAKGTPYIEVAGVACNSCVDTQLKVCDASQPVGTP